MFSVPEPALLQKNTLFRLSSPHIWIHGFSKWGDTPKNSNCSYVIGKIWKNHINHMKWQSPTTTHRILVHLPRLIHANLPFERTELATTQIPAKSSTFPPPVSNRVKSTRPDKIRNKFDVNECKWIFIVNGYYPK